MRDEKSQWLKERSTCTLELEKFPYDSELYLRRALCYEKLGFPDLAASDAYRALLLTDEVLDEEGEYHEQTVGALEARERKGDGPATSGHANGNINGNGGCCKEEENGHTEMNNGDQNGKQWYETVAKTHAHRSYEILARTLAECGDLKRAFDFSERGLIAFPANARLQKLKEQILKKYRHRQLEKDPSWDQSDFKPREDLPENGSARREIYPWNGHEPDRFSEENLSFINAEIQKSGPKCEVRVVELPILAGETSTTTTTKPSTTIKQLGIFTSSAISPRKQSSSNPASSPHPPASTNPSATPARPAFHPSPQTAPYPPAPIARIQRSAPRPVMTAPNPSTTPQSAAFLTSMS